MKNLLHKHNKIKNKKIKNINSKTNDYYTANFISTIKSR